MEPWTTLDVRQPNGIVVDIDEVKEVFFFTIQSLESYFPKIDNVVAVSFSTEVPRYFTSE